MSSLYVGKDAGMNARRGYVPEDDLYFSEKAVDVMRNASRQVCYLLDEGYDLKPATVFVGNHFQLSERQRLAVMRSIAAKTQLEHRREKEKNPNDISGQEVWIDGFNTVITFEVMLSGSPLFEGMDGCIRDLASLRGTYRIIPETENAVKRILDRLQLWRIGKANILLDEPVSNSGRLKKLIAEASEAYCFDLDIQIRKDVDRALYVHENVMTSDSIILDHCKSWINLAAACAHNSGQTILRVW